MATAAATRVGNHNLHAGVIRRGGSAGFSVTAAASYIHRCRIEDLRTGNIHDYTAVKNRPLFSGFFPAANAPDWGQDRVTFWNGVELRENRQDSQLARDFIITLPHEMAPEHARYALQDFIKEQFTRKGYAGDLAIHPAHEKGDVRNLHAHLLTSLRRLEKDGTWSKHKDPAEPDPELLREWKERCAHHLNRQLERFGYDIRVDHRSLKERGEDREPEIKLGKKATALERDGIETDKGNRNRQIHSRNHLRQEIAETLYELHSEGKLNRRVPELEDERPGHRSAIDRQREEDQERQRQGRPKPTSADQDIEDALWKLAQTMGVNLGYWFSQLRAKAPPKVLPQYAREETRPAQTQESHQAWRSFKEAQSFWAEHGILIGDDEFRRQEAEKKRRSSTEPAPPQDPFREAWMYQRGGAGRLTDEQLQSARNSYAESSHRKRQQAETVSFENYVSFAQGKAAELQQQGQKPGGATRPASPSPPMPESPKPDPWMQEAERKWGSRIEPEPSRGASWTQQHGGTAYLTERQLGASRNAYAKWTYYNPEIAARVSFEDYVTHAQEREERRRQKNQVEPAATATAPPPVQPEPVHETRPAASPEQAKTPEPPLSTEPGFDPLEYLRDDLDRPPRQRQRDRRPR